MYISIVFFMFCNVIYNIMSLRLISSLLKQPNIENDVLNNTLVHTSRDKYINELNSLYQTPKPDRGSEMPHYQVLQNGIQQADLLFLPDDNGLKYCLVVVDLHSRKCDAEPITDKTTSTIVAAFKKIYARKILSLPVNITCDSGGEFKAETKKYFEKKGIIIKYAATGRHRQVALVEAKNKKIGSTLHKLMALEELKTKEENREWVKYLPDVVKAINNALPPPIDKLISDEPIANKDDTDVLPIGTKVRILLEYPINIVNGKRLHGIFRSSDIRWSRDIKEITDIALNPGMPIMYKVGNEDFLRTRNQIQVVNPINFV